MPAQNNLEKPEWLHYDAAGKVLGRLSVEIASKLMDKDQVGRSPNEVSDRVIVVTNTDKVALTGKKEEQKVYYRYSGYAGGMKERTVAQQRKLDSRYIVREAVSGMLPKNKLRDRRLNNLKLFKSAEHPYQNKISNK